jgi:hypothetical protein
MQFFKNAGFIRYAEDDDFDDDEWDDEDDDEGDSGDEDEEY